jgi:hypothetical protein
MPIIDPMFRLPTQPLHRLLQHAGVPYLDHLGADSRLHPLPDQPRRHRVGILLHLNRAPLAHSHWLTLQRFQAPRRQRPQSRLLFVKPRRMRPIAPRHHDTHELHIFLATGEVAAATQPQRLVKRLLEAAMRLLTIAVLVTAVRIGRLGRYAVVTHHSLVLSRIALQVAVVVDRQRHAIRAMTLGRCSQGPQRILKTLAEAGKALREAQRHVLPIRIGQNEVVHQMRKRLPPDGHAQTVHVREIRRTEPARLMHLAEKHFLGRPVR